MDHCFQVNFCFRGEAPLHHLGTHNLVLGIVFFFFVCVSSAGSFPDAQLPSKRIIGPKNYEFLTSKREEFQEYLQVEKMGHLRLYC